MVGPFSACVFYLDFSLGFSLDSVAAILHCGQALSMSTVEKLLRKALRLAFALALFGTTAATVEAATATWDPNPETNIAGYKLSYGTTSGVYDTTLDASNA